MSNEAPCKEMEAAKITDLDNLCMEKICGMLDVQSLFNMANVNKSMQAAAVSAYRQNHRTKAIWLHDVCKSRFHVLGDKIFVESLKLILPFLRLFGANIVKMIIMFSENGAHNEHIDRYIGQYCADTLSSVSFHNKPAFPFNFAKPFSQIEAVHIVESKLQQNIHRFTDWFPNMRRLEIDTASISRCDAKAHFPHLEHLTMKHNSIGLSQIEDLLRSNTQLQSFQLQSFHIYADHCALFITTGNLLHLIKGNSLLTKLMASITESPITITNAAEAQRFISEHPLLIELDLPKYLFDVSDALRITRELKSLKMFRFKIKEEEYPRFRNQLSNEWQPNVHKDSYSWYDGCIVTLKR